MNTETIAVSALSAQEEMGIKFPLPLVCPTCFAPLHPGKDNGGCPDCVRNFKFTDNFADLIVGDRFEDQTDEACWSYEEKSNTDLTINYWLPIFEKRWPERGSYRPKLLSLGCGTGIDIDILNDFGFDIVGIEIGNRTKAWKNRKYPERLILANGMKMPFLTETFDAIYCGCVFPHVGVVGDSFVVRENYFDLRLALASEMTRVLKKGGIMLVSSPNGNAPLDLFHDRKLGTYKPRINPPNDPCIPSVADYKKLFVESVCANQRVDALPVRNYWGFIRSKGSIKGFLLGLPVRFLFWLSSTLPFLRGSFIDPWLVVQVQK